MSITEVVSEIHKLDSEADLDSVFEALKARRRTLTSIRAAGIHIGDKVQIVNITPKALSGLTGVVVERTPAEGRSDKYMAVMLDPASTDSLRYARTTRFHVGDQTEYRLGGIPKTCLVPA
jgi:hypothetical protein